MSPSVPPVVARAGQTRRRPRSALLAQVTQRLAYAVAAAAFLWMLTSWALQWW